MSSETDATIKFESKDSRMLDEDDQSYSSVEEEDFFDFHSSDEDQQSGLNELDMIEGFRIVCDDEPIQSLHKDTTSHSHSDINYHDNHNHNHNHTHNHNHNHGSYS